MADNSNGKPVFDFGDLSWGEAQHVEVLQAETQHALESGDTSAIQKSYDNIVDFLARILVSVPDEWIVKRMRGQSIDWSKPDNIRDAIRSDKALPLIRAMAEAQQPDDITKN